MSYALSSGIMNINFCKTRIFHAKTRLIAFSIFTTDTFCNKNLKLTKVDCEIDKSEMDIFIHGDRLPGRLFSV